MVAIAVEGEEGAVGPSRSHGPEHGLPVELVKSVLGVDEKGACRGRGQGRGCGCLGSSSFLFVLLWRWDGNVRWGRYVIDCRLWGSPRSYCMDCSFYSCWEACAEVEVAACCSGLTADDFDEAFCHQSPEDRSNSYGSDSWALVQGDEATCHQAAICRPWGVVVGYPRGPGCHLCSEYIRFCSES